MGFVPSLSFASHESANGAGFARVQKPASASTSSSESKTSTFATSDNTSSSADQTVIRELKKRDQVVRQHEAAHIAAAGGLARGGANFSMQTGPDGKRYAIGGEVKIDISPGNTPEETVRKARIIQAAALAPAEPSGQDRVIATKAKAMEAEATAEINKRSIQQQKVVNSYQTDELPRSTISSEA